MKKVLWAFVLVAVMATGALAQTGYCGNCGDCPNGGVRPRYEVNQ